MGVRRHGICLPALTLLLLPNFVSVCQRFFHGQPGLGQSQTWGIIIINSLWNRPVLSCFHPQTFCENIVDSESVTLLVGPPENLFFLPNGYRFFVYYVTKERDQQNKLVKANHVFLRVLKLHTSFYLSWLLSKWPKYSISQKHKLIQTNFCEVFLNVWGEGGYGYLIRTCMLLLGYKASNFLHWLIVQCSHGIMIFIYLKSYLEYTYQALSFNNISVKSQYYSLWHAELETLHTTPHLAKSDKYLGYIILSLAALSLIATRKQMNKHNT